MERRAVVSGGGTGIGKAVAARLAGDGCAVVILGRRADVLAKAADELNAGLPEPLVTTETADLSEPAQVQDLADRLTAGGRVDVLVNNAGGSFGVPGEGLAGVAAEWAADVRGNVLPAVLLTTALLSALPRPGGRIVVLSSVAGLRGPGSYGGSKAALHAWALGLARSWPPTG
nr:SDR family oxidoreductase [Actinophytocola sp.]